MGRFKKIVSLLCLLIIVSTICILYETSDDIVTHRFCAYGNVYVEFQQGSKIWGTTFLNEDGKPVKCTEDDVQEHTSLQKDSI